MPRRVRGGVWGGEGGFERVPERRNRYEGPLPFFHKNLKNVGPKKNTKNRPPFQHFLGPQKLSKIGLRRIFRGLGRGPKKGTPSRGPKSEILLLFITLELGPRSQKGTPFRGYFGELFSKKKQKMGVSKTNVVF